MNVDRALGVVVLLFAGFFLYESQNLPKANKWDIIGPARYPQAILVMIALLALILIVMSFKKEKKKIDLENYKLTAMVFVLLIAYVFIIKQLGFIATTVIFLFITQFILYPKEKTKSFYITSILVSVIAPSSIYILFSRFLYIYLP